MRLVVRRDNNKLVVHAVRNSWCLRANEAEVPEDIAEVFGAANVGTKWEIDRKHLLFNRINKLTPDTSTEFQYIDRIGKHLADGVKHAIIEYGRQLRREGVVNTKPTRLIREAFLKHFTGDDNET